MNSIEAKLAAEMYQLYIMMAEITIEGFSLSTSEPASDAKLAAQIRHIATTPDGGGMDRDYDIAKLLSKYREAVVANHNWKLALHHDQN